MVESKGFWRRCTAVGITEFLDFVHRPKFWILENTVFRIPDDGQVQKPSESVNSLWQSVSKLNVWVMSMKSCYRGVNSFLRSYMKCLRRYSLSFGQGWYSMSTNRADSLIGNKPYLCLYSGSVLFDSRFCYQKCWVFCAVFSCSLQCKKDSMCGGHVSLTWSLTMQ
jgi:hypothetical protein